MINLCTICMRAGSREVVNKNLSIINKKPLMSYTINQAIKSKIFDYIVVSTDSKKIAKLSMNLGVDKYFMRSKALSTHKAPKIPVIRNTLLKAEKYFNVKFDNIVDLDVTSPLRKVSDIRNSFDYFLETNSPNLITACVSRKNPYFNIIEKKNNRINIVKKSNKLPNARQGAPKTFDMNASIYIWKRKYLLNNKNLFTKKTIMYEMPEERSIDIDSKLDFKFVEYLLIKNND